MSSGIHVNIPLPTPTIGLCMCIVSVLLATVVIFLVAKIIRDPPGPTKILAPVLHETEADPPAANPN